jgi:outer membrane lipoprotein SlyB
MESRSRLLIPLMIVAALSVVVFSGIGVAAITGHLPLARAGANPAGEFSFTVSKAAAAAKARGDNPLRLAANDCVTCGRVQSIETMTPDALAAASGGPLVMRDPNGSTAGNLSEPDTTKPVTGYVVKLRMDDGTTRVIQEHAKPRFTVGQRVRLMNGLVLTLG